MQRRFASIKRIIYWWSSTSSPFLRRWTSGLHELQLAGLRPVITHPERNGILRAQPERLLRWVSLGCYAQITAGSLTGVLARARRKMRGRDWARTGALHCQRCAQYGAAPAEAEICLRGGCGTLRRRNSTALLRRIRWLRLRGDLFPMFRRFPPIHCAQNASVHFFLKGFSNGAADLCSGPQGQSGQALNRRALLLRHPGHRRYFATSDRHRRGRPKHRGRWPRRWRPKVVSRGCVCGGCGL